MQCDATWHGRRRTAAKPGRAANKAAERKVDKYRACAEAMQAVHLPFAVETTGGFSESAQQLVCDSIAIAVQRSVGMALHASVAQKRDAAMGSA